MIISCLFINLFVNVNLSYPFVHLQTTPVAQNGKPTFQIEHNYYAYAKLWDK